MITVSRDGQKIEQMDHREQKKEERPAGNTEGQRRRPQGSRQKFRKGQEVREDIRNERPEGEEVVFAPNSDTLRGFTVTMKPNTYALYQVGYSKAIQ